MLFPTGLGILDEPFNYQQLHSKILDYYKSVLELYKEYHHEQEHCVSYMSDGTPFFVGVTGCGPQDETRTFPNTRYVESYDGVVYQYQRIRNVF